VLEVEEAAALWPEESRRVGTTVICHDLLEPMQRRHFNVSNEDYVIVCGLVLGYRSNDGKVRLGTEGWE